MGVDPRPVDGGDEEIRETGNGPEDPMEMVILEGLFGLPDGGGVYAPPPPADGDE